MRVAIMQPYVFPYIGYFQLLAAVDVFVFYDDVHFIKRGYINRNSILQNGQAVRFTIPCLKASQNKLINAVYIDAESKAISKFLVQLEHVYCQAPYYNTVMPLLHEVLGGDLKGTTISELAIASVKQVCTYLKLHVVFKASSVDFTSSRNLGASERLITITKALGGSTYVNAAGGKALYSKDRFLQDDIGLHFLESQAIRYTQFQDEFVPWLSIIDVMMFNSVQTIRQYLEAYKLT